MTTLSVAETAEDVALQSAASAPGGRVWLAVGPGAAASLVARGIDALTPESVCDAADVVAACVAGRDALRRVTEALDEAWSAAHPTFGAAGIAPYRFHVWSLSGLSDLECRAAAVLRAAAAGTGARQLLVPESPAYPWDSLLRPHNREAVWGRIAAHLAGRGMLPATQTVRRAAAPVASRERWADGIRRSIAWRPIAAGMREQGSRGVVDAVTWASGTSSVALIGGDEWSHCVGDLRDAGYRVVRTSDMLFDAGGRIDHRDRRHGELVGAVRGALDAVRRDGWAGGVLVDPRLQAIWAHFADDCRIGMRRLRRLVQRHRVRAIVRSSSATGRSHALDQSARSLGVPVAAWQHGFVGYAAEITEFHDYNDMLTSDLTLVYGPGAEVAYRARARVAAPPRLRAVGSAKLAGWRVRARGEAKDRAQSPPIVVFATTKYSESAWYLRSRAAASDVALYAAQRSIVTGLLRLVEARGFELVIKLHPGLAFDDPPWARDLPVGEAVRCEKTTSLRDLMSRASAIVIDSPTTTALEALATRVPVFVLSSLWSLDPALWASMARRAVVASSPDALVDAVTRWVRGESYPADVHDDEYFRAFAAADPPEQIRRAAVRALAECIADASRSSPNARGSLV